MPKNFSQILFLVGIAVIASMYLMPTSIMADSVYYSSEVFTIPWGGAEGNSTGGLSTEWNVINEQEGSDSVQIGQWKLSNDGEFVFVDLAAGKVNRYGPTGDFKGFLDTSSLGRIDDVAIADSGEVLVVGEQHVGPGVSLGSYITNSTLTLYMLNSDMEVTSSQTLPSITQGCKVFPSDSNYFYVCSWTSKSAVVEDNRRGATSIDYHLSRYYFSGSLQAPVLIWSGFSDDPQVVDFGYISRSGQPYKSFIDNSGYAYEWDSDQGLKKSDPSGSLDYSIKVVDDPNWSLSYNSFLIISSCLTVIFTTSTPPTTVLSSPNTPSTTTPSASSLPRSPTAAPLPRHHLRCLAILRPRSRRHHHLPLGLRRRRYLRRTRRFLHRPTQLSHSFLHPILHRPRHA